MEIKSAFEVLGLDINSTSEEVKIRYKELSKAHHPDKGGDEMKMAKINSAKQIAIEFANNKSIVKIIQEVTKAENKEILRSQEIDREISSISNNAKRRVGNKLKSLKDVTGFLGVLSGIATLIGTKAIKLFEFAENSPFPKYFLFIIVVTGFYYLIFNSRIKKLEDYVTDFKETLDDKEYFYNLIRSITRDRIGKEITKSDFLNLISEWNGVGEDNSDRINISFLPIIGDSSSPKKISKLIGTKDFAKLLLLKGEQLNFIEKSESLDSKNFNVKYKIL